MKPDSNPETSGQARYPVKQSILQPTTHLSGATTLLSHFKLVLFFFPQITTPIQVARCLGEAYPWVIDIMAICNQIAADQGERDSVAPMTLLQVGDIDMHYVLLQR